MARPSSESAEGIFSPYAPQWEGKKLVWVWKRTHGVSPYGEWHRTRKHRRGRRHEVSWAQWMTTQCLVRTRAWPSPQARPSTTRLNVNQPIPPPHVILEGAKRPKDLVRIVNYRLFVPNEKLVEVQFGRGNPSPTVWKFYLTIKPHGYSQAE